ncbi:MAG TPA: hypothetical protein VF757_01490 [Sphingomicrobium sp.]
MEKIFREDGSVYSMSVLWEDHVSGLVNPDPNPSDLQRAAHGEYGSVILHWPNDRFTTSHGLVDWSTGTIAIYYFGPSAAGRYHAERKEKWRQVVVDRGHSVQVFDSTGNRYLSMAPQAAYLASDVVNLSSPGNLQMSLDDFLAWGTGARTVTVYETLVRDRRSGWPTFTRRIVAEYRVDVDGVARRASQIREATRNWETTLANFKSKCDKTVEETGQIIVT